MDRLEILKEKLRGGVMYELEARFDARKSFYGKAEVMESVAFPYIELKLFSYGTLVARATQNVETNKITCEYLGKYSQTTTRHQKEFFRQLNLCDKEIKELFKAGTMEV